MENKIFYENIHKASLSTPYLDFNMQNINYTSHFHEEIEIIYVDRGDVYLAIDNKEYTLKKGDISIVLPGEIHSYKSFSQNKVYIMKIKDIYTNENINFSQIRLVNSIIEKSSDIYNSLSSIIYNIFIENQNKIPGYEIAINMATNNILLIILRNLDYVIINKAENKKLKLRLNFLNSINNYIEKNFNEDISLSNIASYTRFSTYYFSHYFKEITNKTFFEYLIMYRLDKAISLILLTDDKLTHIAYSCGFNNIRSFNRMFKKYYNTTPSKYKKLTLQK
jgi:AraC-like DNA-binding protein